MSTRTARAQADGTGMGFPSTRSCSQKEGEEERIVRMQQCVSGRERERERSNVIPMRSEGALG